VFYPSPGRTTHDIRVTGGRPAEQRRMADGEPVEERNQENDGNSICSFNRVAAT